MEIKKHGGALVGISPMTPEKNGELRDLLNIEFELLSDLGNLYAKRLDMAYTIPEWIGAAYERIGRRSLDFNDRDHWELPFTVAFAVGRDYRVKYSWKEGDYTRRPNLEQIAEALFP